MPTEYVTSTSSVTKEVVLADNTDIAFKAQIISLNIQVANAVMNEAAKHWETVKWT